MPTDKPKVAAYVPQILKDRLVEFQEKRKISESQAVIIILAEYFGLQTEIDRVSEGAIVGGVTLSNFQKLEDKVQFLMDWKNELEKSFQHSQENIIEEEASRELIDLQKPDFTSGEQFSEHTEHLEEQGSLSSNIQSNLPSSPKLNSENNDNTQSKLLSSTQNEILPETPADKGILQPDVSFKFVKVEVLLKRLDGINKLGSLRTKASKISKKDFIEWSKEKDIDKIAWEYFKENHKIFYRPTSDITDEQKEKLIQWLRENTQ